MWSFVDLFLSCRVLCRSCCVSACVTCCSSIYVWYIQMCIQIFSPMWLNSIVSSKPSAVRNTVPLRLDLQYVWRDNLSLYGIYRSVYIYIYIRVNIYSHQCGWHRLFPRNRPQFETPWTPPARAPAQRWDKGCPAAGPSQPGKCEFQG